eukprot:5018344-Prymnesium_polylepis.2
MFRPDTWNRGFLHPASAGSCQPYMRCTVPAWPSAYRSRWDSPHKQCSFRPRSGQPDKVRATQAVDARASAECTTGPRPRSAWRAERPTEGKSGTRKVDIAGEHNAVDNWAPSDVHKGGVRCIPMQIQVVELVLDALWRKAHAITQFHHPSCALEADALEVARNLLSVIGVVAPHQCKESCDSCIISTSVIREWRVLVPKCRRALHKKVCAAHAWEVIQHREDVLRPACLIATAPPCLSEARPAWQVVWGSHTQPKCADGRLSGSSMPEEGCVTRRLKFGVAACEILHNPDPQVVGVHDVVAHSLRGKVYGWAA